MNLRELSKSIHQNAREKGFWDEPRPKGTVFALLHSELSEALEADRDGDTKQVAIELADYAIRLLDMYRGYGALPPDIELSDFTAQAGQLLCYGGMEFGEIINELHIELVMAFLQFDGDPCPLNEVLAGICLACKYLDIDLQGAIEKKMEKNTERPRLHGRRY